MAGINKSNRVAGLDGFIKLGELAAHLGHWRIQDGGDLKALFGEKRGITFGIFLGFSKARKL